MSGEYLTWPQAILRLEELNDRGRGNWDPPPDLTVNQWAAANRVLPQGTSNRPGEWRSESYQNEIMEAFTDPLVREIVIMKSTQVGASEILNNCAGYIIDVDPQPFMFVLPTLDTAKKYSKTRIARMIDTCPALKKKVRPTRSKSGGNTLLLKEFPGGPLLITGANAGSGLRSDPIRIIFFDEVDGYPSDVAGEGDPVEIAKRRTDSFANYKCVYVSTPKIKKLSRIEKLFENSDQRYYHVPCPFCDHRQPLRWRHPKTGAWGLAYELDEKGEVVPASVRYTCESCGKGIPERYKQTMLDAGAWVAERPDRTRRGYHLNALYSPWKDTWVDLAREWVKAQENREELRSFVNLRLGETFEEQGETVEASALGTRREVYPPGPLKDENGQPIPAEIPPGVGVLTLSVDVQSNRLEAKVLGWGAGEESWLIDTKTMHGDPGGADASIEGSVWWELEQYRLREFVHASGRKVRPAITVIDSGGKSGHTDSVYDFVQPRQSARDRVYAVKGVEVHTKLGLVQEGSTKRHAVRLFTIATVAAKDRIFSRLKLRTPGPGYIHFPAWVSDDYLKQLVAEKKIPVKDKRTNRIRYRWVKTEDRNEALDLEVYSMGALQILQNFLGRARNLVDAAAQLALPADAPAPEPPPTKKPPRGGGWMGNGGGGGWINRY